MSSHEEIKTSFEPTVESAEQFRSDLLWLKSQLSDKSKALIGLKGQQFKIKVYEIVYALWADGIEKGILSKQTAPDFEIKAEEHSFRCTFALTSYPFEATLSVHVRRHNSIWRIFH